MQTQFHLLNDFLKNFFAAKVPGLKCPQMFCGLCHVNQTVWVIQSSRGFSSAGESAGGERVKELEITSLPLSALSHLLQPSYATPPSHPSLFLSILPHLLSPLSWPFSLLPLHPSSRPVHVPGPFINSSMKGKPLPGSHTTRASQDPHSDTKKTPQTH